MQYRQPWAALLARLTQRALVECLLLAITGGLAGLLVAWGGVRLILHLALPEAPANINTGPSWSVLGFALQLPCSLDCCLAWRSWLAAHANPIEALRGANRSTVTAPCGRRRSSSPRRLQFV